MKLFEILIGDVDKVEWPIMKKDIVMSFCIQIFTNSVFKFNWFLDYGVINKVRGK